MSQWGNDLIEDQWVLHAGGDQQWFSIIESFHIVDTAETVTELYNFITIDEYYNAETIDEFYEAETI